MAPVKSRRRLRLHLVLWAVGGVVAGFSLLALSRAVHSPPTPATTVQDRLPEGDPVRPAPANAAANLSAMLFLLALVSLAVTAVAIGWLVIDLGRRPSRQTRTRHPRR